MEISSLARSFPGHSLLPAPNGRNSPAFGAIVSLRKRLCSSKEMPMKDFLPMSSVVEAGHPGLNASSSVRTLRLGSGVVTMILGLPNMKALYIPVAPYLHTTPVTFNFVCTSNLFI
nr:hypothetical protein Iba_chr04eCG18700 [Ipomoea batatas]